MKKILDRIYGERGLVIAFATLALLGWERRGAVGAVAAPVAGALFWLLAMVASAAWTAWRYYRHNEHRSKWNAFLYILGIGR